MPSRGDQDSWEPRQPEYRCCRYVRAVLRGIARSAPGDEQRLGARGLMGGQFQGVRRTLSAVPVSGVASVPAAYMPSAAGELAAVGRADRPAGLKIRVVVVKADVLGRQPSADHIA
jgi:hypothetical protein